MKTIQKLNGRRLHGLFQQLHGEPFKVVYADGSVEEYGNGTPKFTIRFRDDDFFKFWGGDLSLNFGEAYMSGQFEVEGDLADLIAVALRSGVLSGKTMSKSLTRTVLRRAAGARSLTRQKKDIEHHYDLGNEFFRLWLDKSLTYSCAYFRDPSDTLEQAQQQKREHSLAKLRLEPGESLLDIGCGWGALVIEAAEHFGVQALGITLSSEQDVGASATIEARGLWDRAMVRLVDYHTLAGERRQFDKIISIGMMEHVGKAHLPEFIEDVKTMLRPGGLALLHLITGTEDGPINRWVEKYIFPGGYIPTIAEIFDYLLTREFHVWDVENLGPHYRLTLDAWSERFERAVPLIRGKFDERFVRMWRLYLRVFSAAFREGRLEVHQILISRGNPSALPLTREELYNDRSAG